MFRDYTVSGTITEDGRLELADREAFAKAMRHFKRGPVSVRVEVDRGKRTTQQNRFYRLILGIIAEFTGDDPEYLHEHFKRTFIEPKRVEVLGHEITIWTTTEENYDDFWLYIEKIRRFAFDELDIVTPDPDPALRGKSRHAKRRAA
jgi:hypothetical protein